MQYDLLSLLGHPSAESFFFFIFGLLSWSAFLAKELSKKDPEIEHLVAWFDNVLCSAGISRLDPLRSPARSPVLSPSVLFLSVKQLGWEWEGRNQEMQQILNRNIALLIFLNCMFSVMIPSRDNLLPCSILKGDQQSDLFCTFVRVSALAIFAKCMYSLKPTKLNLNI